MNRSLWLGLLCLLPLTATADTVVRVQAVHPSRVYMDGEFMGNTPLTLSAIRQGRHTVKVADSVTKATKSYVFHATTPISPEHQLKVVAQPPGAFLKQIVRKHAHVLVAAHPATATAKVKKPQVVAQADPRQRYRRVLRNAVRVAPWFIQQFRDDPRWYGYMQRPPPPPWNSYYND